MKVCAYCDSYNDDDAKVCSSCGAKVFKNTCVNCGEVFDGDTCPKCGVKVGAQPKKCPRCGKQYYTDSCPDCANSTSGSFFGTLQNNGTQTQTRKKGSLLLWILGWIFIFPVPLTILVLRSQRIGKLLKIVIIAVAWMLYFGIGFTSDSVTTDYVSTGTSTTSQSNGLVLAED